MSSNSNRNKKPTSLDSVIGPFVLAALFAVPMIIVGREMDGLEFLFLIPLLIFAGGVYNLNSYMEENSYKKESSDLTNIKIPNRPKRIKLPRGATNIEPFAFQSDNSLKIIEIPEGVTSIGEGAFLGCEGLMSIHIPEGVTTIGDFAFSRCKNLRSINIPKSVTIIGHGAFNGCDSLTDIYYGGSESEWAALNVSVPKNTAVHYARAENDEEKRYPQPVSVQPSPQLDIAETVSKAKKSYEAKDYETAVKLFLQAGEAGDSYSQLMLGQCYEYGRGVAKTPEQAFKWYKKAADQGDTLGQLCLGVCYENGIGVARDYGEAASLYKMAAQKGNARAQCYYALCLKNGKGIPQNDEEAVFWYEKAAKQNNAQAQNNLGVCYNHGEGVEKNSEKALELFKKAAANGDENAKRNVVICEKEIEQQKAAKREAQKKQAQEMESQLRIARQGQAISLWHMHIDGSAEGERVGIELKACFYPQTNSVVIEDWYSKRGWNQEIVKVPAFIKDAESAKRYLSNHGYTVY